MGTILKAKCECGYENEKIYLGSGLEDIGVCYFPALKNGSSLIEMKDIRKKQNHLEYIFYNDNLLYNSGDSEGIYNAWEFKLKQEHNFCPKCKKYDMSFIYLGQYD